MLYKFRLDQSILNNNINRLSNGDSGLIYSKDQKKDVEDKIFKAVNGVISAKTLADNLFPELEPHIFISHSSKDAPLAIALANTLYEKYRIVSFIDSQLWGHIDYAIDEMHRLYCRIGDSSSYYYNKSNNLLAHIHSILSMALMRVMDKSDSVIFIESGNSIYNYINQGKITPMCVTETLSPWISSEICFANTIRNVGHSSRQNSRVGTEDYKLDDKGAMSFIKHQIDLSEFIKISNNSFINSMNVPRQHHITDTLDSIYTQFVAELISSTVEC